MTLSRWAIEEEKLKLFLLFDSFGQRVVADFNDLLCLPQLIVQRRNVTSSLLCVQDLFQ
jgi:hypothetical protein